jgi:radical SAM protein with 4Fe4S-binding SPASM domain
MRKTILDGYNDNNIYRLDTLKIKIHEACNLKCKMCNHWRRKNTSEEISTARLLELINEAAAYGCKKVTFTGGEPTLRKDLEEIFSRAKQHDLSVSLLTNGFIVSPERLNALVANGLSKVSVSIDSPIAEEHDNIRGINGAFKRSTEFIRNCTLLRHTANPLHEVLVATCLLKTNQYKFPEMVDLVKDLGVDTFSVIRIDQHNEDGIRLGLTDDEMQAFQTKTIPYLKEQCREKKIKFRISGIDEDYGLKPDDELKDLPCYFAWANVTIASNGDVFCCCDLIQSPNALMGNINRMSLQDILKSERAETVLSLVKERRLSFCRRCYWENDYNLRVHQMFKRKRALV